MSEAPDRDARPQQATLGAGMVIAAGVLHVFGSFDHMRNLRSVETKERLDSTLSTPSGGSLGINQDQLLDWMHVGLLVSAAAATAAIVMGIQALRRESVAPKVLIGLSALTLLGAVLLDPLMGMFLAAGTAMLWSGPARDWFAHRPVRASRLELAMSETPREPQQGAEPPQAPQTWPTQSEQPSWQQPQAPAPYGAPQPPQQAPHPYGAPAYGLGAPQQQWAPQRRPGAPGPVKAAALITVIATGLVAVVYAFLIVAIFAAQDQIMAELERNPQVQDLNITGADLRNIIVAASIFLLIWSVIAMVLAVLTWRRQNWARIMLIVSAVVTALMGLLALPFSLLHIAAAISVVVLLLTGPAREWFNRTPQFQAPYPGQPGAPGNLPGYGQGQQYPPYQQPPQQQYQQQQPPPYQQQPPQGNDQQPPQNPQQQGDQSGPPRDEDGKPPVW